MPEGHTIHRLARDLGRRLVGGPVAASSPQGRFGAGAGVIDGLVLERTEAHGKHLFLGFAGQRWVHVHLGLYGTVTVGPSPAPPPRGAVRLRLEADDSYADLRGPTACEVLDPRGKLLLHARLGPDPLRRDADPDRVWWRLSRSRAPIGTLLLDQAVVSGVGNVYRAEVLFRAGVSPFRPGRELPHLAWLDLWDDLVRLMRAGARAGRIVTTEPVDRPVRRRRPSRSESFYVYERAGLPCRRCGTLVASAELGARRIVWCPRCQPG